MAVYILSDAELHISKKLTALKKGINISKVQFFLILLITCNIDNNRRVIERKHRHSLRKGVHHGTRVSLCPLQSQLMAQVYQNPAEQLE